MAIPSVVRTYCSDPDHPWHGLEVATRPAIGPHGLMCALECVRSLTTGQIAEEDWQTYLRHDQVGRSPIGHTRD